MKHKTAIVTGGNTGIGKAISIALAKGGFKVLIHYLGHPDFSQESEKKYDDGISKEKTKWRQEEAINLRDELRDQGYDVDVFEADLSGDKAASRLFDFTETAFGNVDVLINNAAHCELPDTILSTTPETINNHFQVNVKGNVLLIRAFAERHINENKGWGRIINISTDHAQNFPTQISYGASKAALEAYTRSLAYELGEYGIAVNCIAPGPVQTGWITEELEKQLIPHIPMKRIGTPEDIAHCIEFLVSDKADWITGQVIKVSGGHGI